MCICVEKILEVPEDELKEYWDRYEPLKREMPLLAKLSGHKEKGILTVYRYASGNIDSPQQLFLAIQESVKAALEKAILNIRAKEHSNKPLLNGCKCLRKKHLSILFWTNRNGNRFCGVKCR